MIANNTNTFSPNSTIVPPVDPGITTTDAYSLGQINGDISIQHSVGGNDAGDAYSFTVAESGEYSFNLDGLTADADLRIYDNLGNLVAVSELTENASESLTLELNPGNYYVSVPSFDGVATNYNLSISDGSDTAGVFPEFPEEIDDPGNTFDTALDFGTFTNGGNNVFAFADSIGGIDPFDFFEFTVTETQQFSAAIENLTADADLVLFDSNQVGIAGSATDGIVDTESFSTTINPGTYILGVQSYDGIETNYNLSITSGVDSSSTYNDFGDFGINEIPIIDNDFGGQIGTLYTPDPGFTFV